MDTDHRFWLIELMAYWEGEISTRHLQHFFQLSRQQASKYLVRYRRQHPGKLEYCPRLKRFVPTPEFIPEHITGNVNEYLDWMTGRRIVPEINDPALTLQHLSLSPPPRSVSHIVMRGLVKAMRQQYRLEVDYLSVSNPDEEGRIIVPHTFVNTGLRWHLRAWCEKNRDYRDFVLSRFRGRPELLGPSEHGAEQDHAWNTFVKVILRPDPRLSKAKQAVVAQDYKMTNGQLILTTRAALVQYLLQEMQVSVKVLDGTPEAQQLVLANAEELRPWLFNS